MAVRPHHATARAHAFLKRMANRLLREPERLCCVSCRRIHDRLSIASRYNRKFTSFGTFGKIGKKYCSRLGCCTLGPIFRARNTPAWAGKRVQKILTTGDNAKVFDTVVVSDGVYVINLHTVRDLLDENFIHHTGGHSVMTPYVYTAVSVFLKVAFGWLPTP
jgi:hypothetical protein